MRKDKRWSGYHSAAMKMVGSTVLGAALLFLSSCSSVGWVLHHNPPISEIYVTDEEVAECIAELSVEPTDKDAVLYNSETDRYEMRPDAYAKALKDGIMYRLTKEKIATFADDYKEDTIGTSIKRDFFDILFGGILVGVGLLLL